MTSEERRLWALALAMTAALYFLGLSGRDLRLPDEPRDAGIAVSMARTADLVVPRLNGEPFLEKPPLSYAAAALAIGLWPGAPETAARLPSALFCLGTLACTAWLGWRLAGPEAGLAAAGMLGTCHAVVELGHTCIVDAGLCFWTVLAVASAWEAGLGRRGLWLFSAAAMGAGFLSKGPVGVALPAAGILAMRLAAHGRSFLKGVPWEAMALVVTAVSAAWLWPLSRREGMLGAYVADHTRRLGSGVEHAEPPYFYLHNVFEGFAPWCVLIPFALRSRARVAWAWLLADLLLLSVPTSKRGLYLVPAYPALAIAAASALPHMPRLAGWGLVLAAGPGLPAVCALGGLPHFGRCEGLTAAAACLAAWGVARAWQAGLRGKALATAVAGAASAWVYLACVWAPREAPARSVSPCVKRVLAATGRAPLAGMDLSEPVRGAVSFACGRDVTMLRDEGELAQWLTGSPAAAVVQGQGDPDGVVARLDADGRLSGLFLVVERAKVRRETLVFVANPAALAAMWKGQKGGSP